MLSRTPFVSPVLSFMTGVLLGEYFFRDSHLTLLILEVATCALLFALVTIVLLRRQAKGSLILLFFLLSGALAVSFQNDWLDQDQALFEKQDCEVYTAIISSLPEKRTKNFRYEIRIDQYKSGTNWNHCDIKALMTIPLDAVLVPQPGNRVLVIGSLDRPSQPLNPDEFNYPLYLRNKGIVWVDYLQNGTYQIIDSDNSLSQLRSWSFSMSGWADQVFRKQIKDDESYGLVKAMLLGRRDDLRSEQVDNYTISGTVHILSVSGMHVAIIFLVLSKLLGWVKKLPGGRLIYLLLIVASLGFYALVTGLPPSVQRATLMCVIFVIAETFSRKQQSVNTLAISALLILVFDPHALFDIGFQLSFLAMAGIFLFYKPIADIWQPTGRISAFLWEITVLSFAAQLATFPLSLYYFHQFPTYFWLVNPFVIFFTNILLPASMVLLLVSIIPIEWLQFLPEQAVYFSAYLTNISVAIPKYLPGYVLTNLHLDHLEVVMLYLLMLIVWYSLESRQLKILQYSLFLTVIFVMYSVSQSVQLFYSPAAIIHSIPRHSVVSFKNGDQLYVMSDSAFVNDKDAYNFRIANYAINHGVLNTVYLYQSDKLNDAAPAFLKCPYGELALWNGRLFTRGKFIRDSNIDYQVVTNGMPPNDISSQSLVMLGGEIRYKRADQWKEYLLANQIPFYDLSEKAYWVPE
ncbi:ComEC family competence protein [Dyadobacter luteus]|jgi:competence protein ComEC|uniref:ComEC family competence protein n=1 Tax=Dyadobacter luteus TaxID=2259619 RepID=A0A3D8YHA9_9BACT|nr:ComEC/Rec2 family competence protein [Dyadobacter luteus]REA64075.1 ComEC family competence protein [Dyadobacter luteus]